MPRIFNWSLGGGGGTGGSGLQRGPRFWLQVGGIVLALLNGIALFLYVDPPGGSRKELEQDRLQVRNQIILARAKALRVKNAATKVQDGSTESAIFELKYFLPKRKAYAAMIAEIQKIASAAGFEERDAQWTEEPIEGTADLSLLNCTASFEGTYPNLMRFLYQVDQSPMLLILENMQAAPQQKSGQIAASIRFQTIIEEETSGDVAAGAPSGAAPVEGVGGQG